MSTAPLRTHELLNHDQAAFTGRLGSMVEYINQALVPDWQAKAEAGDTDAEQMIGIAQVTARTLAWLFGEDDQFLDQVEAVVVSAESSDDSP